MLHGEKESKKVEDTAKKTFTENDIGSALPTFSINKNQLSKEINILDLITMSKLEISKSEARRLIKSKGVKINNNTVENDKYIIKNDLFENGFIKLSIGKKKHLKVGLV